MGVGQGSTDELCSFSEVVNRCQVGESAMGRERSGKGHLFGFLGTAVSEPGRSPLRHLSLFHRTNISRNVII